ncbi:PPID, partial [Symbiodinium natans]
VSLRGIVTRLDRTVIIESREIDGTGGSAYGGHIEVFDVALGDLMGSSVVGECSFQYTNFHSLGKGALSAAVKITYGSNFEPPPVLIFHGNSWTDSVEYALHLESSNAPVLITNNVMFRSMNGGIFSQKGSAAVQIKDNAIIGLKLADTAPRMTLQSETDVVVPQYAGIRLDQLPVRMIGNVVAGSRDMGYLTPAEPCPPRAMFNNEATAVIVGAFLLTARQTTCMTFNLFKVWKAAHAGVYLSDTTPSRTILTNIVVSDSHIGILPYLSIGSAFRRVYVYNSTLIGTSPAGTNCEKSNFCRTQTISDPYMDTCSSMYNSIGLRRVGFVAPIRTNNKKQPKLNGCHQAWEKDIHMQKGLGWVFFEDTRFAYWKSDDCGYTDRAIAPNMFAAEVSFPMSFTNTTWYESDLDARFELSTERLDDGYGGRVSPCKSTGGGCMGLDQLLLQDMDGTLTGIPNATNATILPLTPRTEIVWASQCNASLLDTTIAAQACPNMLVDLLEMTNLDRGAKDIKFGPLVLTPDEEEDNGFNKGVLSSVGPFYASCPCGWDFSFYHILIKPDSTYYMEVMSLPENFKLRYWNPRPEASVLLEIFYPDSRGVNVFVGGASKPDMALKLGRKPTLDDEHGAHVVDAQALRLYVTLRGSPEGFAARRDLVIRRTPTVKLKMNIEISITEFNGPQFQTNLAILLGIPPERIAVASVAARRRLKLVEVTEEDSDASVCTAEGICQTPGRRLATVDITDLDISIEPSKDAVWDSALSVEGLTCRR